MRNPIQHHQTRLANVNQIISDLEIERKMLALARTLSKSVEYTKRIHAKAVAKLEQMQHDCWEECQEALLPHERKQLTIARREVKRTKTEQRKAQESYDLLVPSRHGRNDARLAQVEAELVRRRAILADIERDLAQAQQLAPRRNKHQALAA